MVTATFDVLNGEEVIASTVVQQKVEETDSSREVFHPVIAKEKLNADTTIRITMRTKDFVSANSPLPPTRHSVLIR